MVSCFSINQSSRILWINFKIVMIIICESYFAEKCSLMEGRCRRWLSLCQDNTWRYNGTYTGIKLSEKKGIAQPSFKQCRIVWDPLGNSQKNRPICLATLSENFRCSLKSIVIFTHLTYRGWLTRSTFLSLFTFIWLQNHQKFYLGMSSTFH